MALLPTAGGSWLKCSCITANPMWRATVESTAGDLGDNKPKKRALVTRQNYERHVAQSAGNTVQLCRLCVYCVSYNLLLEQHVYTRVKSGVAHQVHHQQCGYMIHSFTHINACGSWTQADPASILPHTPLTGTSMAAGTRGAHDTGNSSREPAKCMSH